MKKRIPSFLLFIGYAALLHAAGESNTSGARATAMAGASVTLQDVYSAINNQAGLGFLNTVETGLYSDRKFLNASINNIHAVVGIPVRKAGTFGFSAQFLGYKYYNETKIGIAYARAFGQKFSLGVQLDYLRFSVYENGQLNLATLQLGVLYKPWKKFSLGAHIYNPIPYKVAGNILERIPTIVKFGIGYEPHEKVLVTAEYEQDIYLKPRFKTGLEYRPLKLLSIRGGMHSNPFAATFGFGLNVKSIRLDVAGGYHPVLGFTPHLSVTYQHIRKAAKKP